MARPPEHQAVKRVWESQLSAAGAALFNKVLHWTPIPLRSIGASELGRYVLFAYYCALEVTHGE